MSKRTWVPLLLVITALLLIVSCGDATTESDAPDIEEMETKIRYLEYYQQQLESEVQKLRTEAAYVHGCVFHRELSHGSHDHQTEDLAPHSGCWFRDNYWKYEDHVGEGR